MTKRSANPAAAWVPAGLAASTAACLGVVFLIGLSGCSEQDSAAQAQSVRSDRLQAAGPAERDQSRGGQDQPVPVKVAQLAPEHLQRFSTPHPAYVAPYEKTEIYAKAAGYLETFGEVQSSDGTSRPLDIGDRVAQGQLLARLSIPEMDQQLRQKEAAIGQAEAEVVQATAAIAQATAELYTAQALVLEAQAEQIEKAGLLQSRQADYGRIKGLVGRDAVSQELLDEKQYQLAAAQGAVQAAEARIKSARAKERAASALIDKATADRTVAEKRLEAAQADAEYVRTLMQYAEIKAPYDGLITRRWVDTGALVQSAASGKTEPLFTLARIDRLRIVADIPEEQAGLVQIGQPVQVSFSRGQPLPGKVVRFADALDSGTRNMRTEIELADSGKFLRPGLFGSVTITLADVPDALVLPTSAVLTDAGKPCVMCIEQGQAKRREVELGLNDGGRVQVIRGLTAGSQVITDGVNRVRDGQPVEVIN